MIKTFSKLTLVASLLGATFVFNASAQEINQNGFSGTLNTTVSHGVSIRASERDCTLVVGYTTDLTRALGQVPKVSGTGQGCDVQRIDPNGNLSSKPLKIGSQNSDDGNMNYDNLDVFSATQKVYAELLGDYNGMGVNVSVVASVNPALSIYEPTYAPFTSKAESEFEKDFELLNAYVTTSQDLGDSYLDFTIGRQVTNWGESTFIPIGMNGMVTNAIDLSKLRAPGSSIREALMPTEQITVSGDAGGGVGFEFYYQLSAEQVKLDAASSFFGNEAVGPGGKGQADAVAFLEATGDANCPYSITGTDTAECTAANVAATRTDAGIALHSGNYLVNNGLRALAAESGVGEQNIFVSASAGATAVWGGTHGGADTLTGNSAAQWSDLLTAGLAVIDNDTYASAVTYYTSLSGDIDTSYKLKSSVGNSMITSAVHGSAFATAGTMAAAYTALDATTAQDINDRFGSVYFARDNNFDRHADDSGQWGVKFSGYSDYGTGVDWSVHAANYHSKVPYVQYTGPGGIYSGDLYGIFASIRAKDSNKDLSLNGTVGTDFSAGEEQIYKGLVNGYYSSGVCDAVLGSPTAAAYLNAIDGAGALDNDGTALAKANAANAAHKSYGKYWTALGVSSMEKAWAERQQWDTLTGNEYSHNSAICYAGATSLTSVVTAREGTGLLDDTIDFHDRLAKVGNMLSAAIAPLNYSTYHLIYPEDLTALGFSFNTNVNGTTINAEVTYRPDFPLATNPVDQINQIGDVSGAFDMLDALAFEGVAQLGNSNTDNYASDLPEAGDPIDLDFFDPDNPTATSCAMMAVIGRVTPTVNGLGACVLAGTTLSNYIPNDTAVVGFGSTGALTKYQAWHGSQDSGNSLQIAIAAYRKAIYEGAIAATLNSIDPTGTTAANVKAACTSGPVGNGVGSADYSTCVQWLAVYNNLTTTQKAGIDGAYDGSLWAFNRSSLPAIARATSATDYLTTPFIEYDVWTVDVGTTTSFSASHPIVKQMGADSAVLLTEVGIVRVDGMDNTTNGYVKRNGAQSGIGNAKCLGGLGGTLDSSPYNFGLTTAVTHLGAAMADGLFGNGKYCEMQSGADETSLTYRVIGSATYNNFNNSRWSLSPRAVWSHDPYGYGPSSMGGFVEGKMAMTLGLGLQKGNDISADLSYVNQLGDEMANTSGDMDYVSASISYAF